MRISVSVTPVRSCGPLAAVVAVPAAAPPLDPPVEPPDVAPALAAVVAVVPLVAPPAGAAVVAVAPLVPADAAEVSVVPPTAEVSVVPPPRLSKALLCPAAAPPPLATWTPCFCPHPASARPTTTAAVNHRCRVMARSPSLSGSLCLRRGHPPAAPAGARRCPPSAGRAPPRGPAQPPPLREG